MPAVTATQVEDDSAAKIGKKPPQCGPFPGSLQTSLRSIHPGVSIEELRIIIFVLFHYKKSCGRSLGRTSRADLRTLIENRYS